MKNIVRLTLSLSVATVTPVLVATLFSVCNQLIWDFYKGVSGKDSLYNISSIAHFIAALFYSALNVFLFGVPAYITLNRLNKLFCWSAILCGFLIAFITAFMYILSIAEPFNIEIRGIRIIEDGITAPNGWILIGEFALVAGILGAVSGLSFWTVWYALRPKKF